MNFVPFGFRVFVEVDTHSLDNIGTDFLSGTITQVGYSLEAYRTMDYKIVDMNTLLYKLSDELRPQTKVLFKYDKNIVDVDNNIYNVPIELIRKVCVPEVDDNDEK